MITKDYKISKMLNDYPQTFDVMLKASPHFSKLNNKVLRKTLATRVTVEQASKIAGVDLGILLENLNSSIGVKINNPKKINMKNEIDTPQNGKPELLSNVSAEKIKQLDVRPVIDSGRDPFSDIMNFIKELKDDEIFLLINSFEPIPLYSVLSKKGFEHYTEKIDSVFKVYFYKSVPGESTNINSSEGFNENNGQNDITNVIEIDVRKLEPPEPMIKILEMLAQVDEKSLLLVHHHREPMMLYPKLEERGYQAVSNKIEENYYKVVITKKGNGGNE